MSQTTLGPLRRADGSATHSHGGYTVIAAVNGPIEVQRRDEIPDEAAIEVNVRPAVGVGGPRERHLETLISSVLRAVLLTHLHPRTLVQITLQILSTPPDLSSTSHVPLLPALLAPLVPALLHAAIPLASTPLAALVALAPSGEVLPDPSPAAVQAATSMHAFVFAAPGGEVLLVESEGRFGVAEWERAADAARGRCFGDGGDGQGGLWGEVRGAVAGFVGEGGVVA